MYTLNIVSSKKTWQSKALYTKAVIDKLDILEKTVIVNEASG